MTDGPAPNLRLHPRHRVLKAGKIVFSNLGASIDVTIRDMGIGGARVRVPANIALPKLFNLLVVTDGLLFPAELRWHRGEYVGIKFVGEPRPTALKGKQISRDFDPETRTAAPCQRNWKNLASLNTDPPCKQSALYSLAAPP